LINKKITSGMGENIYKPHIYKKLISKINKKLIQHNRKNSDLKIGKGRRVWWYLPNPSGKEAEAGGL
jgi:hypothetical protein